MGIKIIDNSKKYLNVSNHQLDNALARMAQDIMLLSKVRVPLKTGSLQKSVEITKQKPMKYRVVYNKEYAAYQERGRRRDGSHVVRRYTTPDTGVGYLEKAGDRIVSDIINYIKQAVMLTRI